MNIRRLLSLMPAVAMAVAPLAAHALTGTTGTSKLYLQPAPGSYASGAQIRVAVRLTDDVDPVNAVQANLAYPQNRLQFSSIDSAGSSFDIAAPSKGGNGTVEIARGALQPVKGNALVATVVFKVLAAGTADLEFAQGSAVPRAADARDTLGTRISARISLGSSSGGTHTVTTKTTTSSSAVATPGSNSVTAVTPKPAGVGSQAPKAGVSLASLLTLGIAGSNSGPYLLGVLVLIFLVVSYLLYRNKLRRSDTTPSPSPPTNTPPANPTS
jgi:hypothetical protein